MECGAIPTHVPVGRLRLSWIIWISLEPRARHACEDAQEAISLLYRTGFHSLSFPCVISSSPSHTSTLQVSGRTPLEFGGSGQRLCLNLRIRATQGMLKRKNFNRRTRSCTSTRTHLERHLSVELRNLFFKPCPRKPRAGVSGALWRPPKLVLMTLYRI